MQWFSELLSTWVPQLCVLCQQSTWQGQHGVCATCWRKLVFLPCTQTGTPQLVLRMAGTRQFKHCLAAYVLRPRSVTRHLVHCLKYQGHWKLGEIVGLRYGRYLASLGWDSAFDLILPVPLHRHRLCKRTYNQSVPFAAGLSMAWNVPWSEGILIRNRITLSQVGKNRLERLKNVIGAFEVRKPKRLVHQRILLVDDVVTSGATLQACAQAISITDCSSISMAALAMAEQGLDPRLDDSPIN